jgi:glutathione peroxidase
MLNILFGLVSLLASDIYSYEFTDVEGKLVKMSDYKGKKILLVNISTGNKRVSQLGELQQLHKQYGDRVAIIAFPSNSFGNEAMKNAAIREFCASKYGVTFKIAGVSNVSGTGLHPVYNWLSKKSENGVMDGVVGADFQKFLIDKEGNITGMFSPSTLPMDKTIVEAITEN